MRTLFIQLLALVGLARGATLGEAAIVGLARSVEQLDAAHEQLTHAWYAKAAEIDTLRQEQSDIASERDRFARVRARLSLLID
jgi:hypothetical protein